MFLQHFQLQHQPFDRSIPCSSLYPSTQMEEALARLLYACDQRSLAVLTGDVGAGKSTALRLLQSRLDPNRYLFIYLADSELTPKAFYTLALLQMGVAQPPFQLTKLKTMFKRLAEEFHQGKGVTCVLAVDEAQDLPLSMAKEIRFVMNFRTDSYSPLALVLTGQVEFRGQLQTLLFAPVRRRVETFSTLAALSAPETAAYIDHQMTCAGAVHPLFPNDVTERIHDYAKGIAASINTLCKRALLDAATRNQKLIELANVDRAAKELF